VLDLFSRMVVGWSMAALQDATLVVTALEMALVRRRPQAGLLHHSDRGSISTSESYLALLQQNAMTVSMSRTANCSDNAVTEAFASLASKMNVVIRSPFSPVLRLVIAPLSIWKLVIIELVDIPP
jgi:putative transposase